MKAMLTGFAAMVLIAIGAYVGLGGGLAAPVSQIATWRAERPGAAKPSIVGRICGR